MSLLEELHKRSEVVASGCREWRAAIDGAGYGAYHIKRKSKRAHRLACEIAHGPPPEGKPWALHHCDNPLCIEGSHLYWGSPKDNARDRIQRGRDGKGTKTHCKNGHEFTEKNTYYKSKVGTRACKACSRDRQKRYYHERKARTV